MHSNTPARSRASILTTAIVLRLLISAATAGAADPNLCREKSPPPPLPQVRITVVVQGLSQPVGLAPAADGSGRLFVVQQAGVIRVLQAAVLQPQAFLDLSDRVIAGGELGLLGLAFHPRFSENGRLFVNYTSETGGLHSVIAEFRTRPNTVTVDRNSERILLTVPQPYRNHNGGAVAFGPDGYLYAAFGDGGSANDPEGNGQKLTTLLGKMLRIDVDHAAPDRSYSVPPDNPLIGRAGARPEIWAWGLRNPWRFAFDPDTGRLYTGDVGQNSREEIDVIQKGRNYGWNIMEGTICSAGVNPACDRTGLELPILDYGRADGIAVIGGTVYRGRRLPALCGVYVYADYGNGRISGLRYDGQRVTHQGPLAETGRSITALGEDDDHELYLTDHAGAILKIVP